MAEFGAYKDRYRNINLRREGGILEMQLHTRGGPLKWGAKDDNSVHAQLGDAFYQIARDPENLVLILTGTGDEFLTAWTRTTCTTDRWMRSSGTAWPRKDVTCWSTTSTSARW
jgi:hypothetical protein